jgi:hypothetical protein
MIIKTNTLTAQDFQESTKNIDQFEQMDHVQFYLDIASQNKNTQAPMHQLEFNEEVKFLTCYDSIAEFDWGKLRHLIIISLEKESYLVGEILKEIVRFFALKVYLDDIEGDLLYPSELLRQCWILFMQLPQDYNEFCSYALNKSTNPTKIFKFNPLERLPPFTLSQRKEVTRGIYKKFFKEDLPYNIWY